MIRNSMLNQASQSSKVKQSLLSPSVDVDGPADVEGPDLALLWVPFDCGLRVLSFHHNCIASDVSHLDRGGASIVIRKS